MSDHQATAVPTTGNVAILAHRYVSALFSLAESQGAVEAVLGDMEKLRKLWADVPEWRFVACDPRLSSLAAAKAAAEVAKLAETSALTAKFLAVIAQNRRLPLLPLLVEGFFAEVDLRRGEFRAEVRTARPLSAAQSEKLAASLKVIVGGKVHMSVVEDASLMGGFTVKMGSHFIDASVASRLDQLERSLKQASAAA